MLPNAIIIGVQKAATTTIYEWLSQHPEVYGNPSMKEYNFFNNKENLGLGLNWFEKSFAGYTNEKVCLHGYVKYIDDTENLVKEVHKYNGECKFIISLRSPVERAYSGYWEGKKTARLESNSFYDEVVSRKDLNGELHINSSSLCISDSFYSKKIKKLLGIVKIENVKFINYHQLLNDPKKTVSEVFAFLDVDNTFEPNMVKSNESGVARSYFIQKLFQKLKAPIFLKKYLSGSLLSNIKTFLIRKVNVKRAQYPKMDTELKVALDEYFKQELDEIKMLTGIDLRR